MNSAASHVVTLGEPWVIKIFDEVARQAYRRIGAFCFMTTDDIRQDLLFDAVTDTSFLLRLNATTEKTAHAKLARAFAEKSRRRRCRQYMSRWPRLNQRRQHEG